MNISYKNMVKENIRKELEEKALEFSLVRGLKNRIDAKDKELSYLIKSLMSSLRIRVYDGRRVEVRLGSSSYPREVDPKTASKYVPFKDFLDMISVDKEKFEAYLVHKGKKVEEDKYLVSKGKYDKISRPTVKLPIREVKSQFEKLYSEIVSLVISEKKKSRKKKRK